jgi:hypothetical protein
MQMLHRSKICAAGAGVQKQHGDQSQGKDPTCALPYLGRRAYCKHAFRFFKCNQEILTNLIALQCLSRLLVMNSIVDGGQFLTIKLDISLVVIEYQEASLIRKQLQAPEQNA